MDIRLKMRSCGKYSFLDFVRLKPLNDKMKELEEKAKKEMEDSRSD